MTHLCGIMDRFDSCCSSTRPDHGGCGGGGVRPARSWMTCRRRCTSMSWCPHGSVQSAAAARRALESAGRTRSRCRAGRRGAPPRACEDPAPGRTLVRSPRTCTACRLHRNDRHSSSSSFQAHLRLHFEQPGGLNSWVCWISCLSW